MERSFLFVLMLAAIFGSSVAGAQQRDPTVPEDARDEQTMVPEDADDDVTPGESADDTPTIREATAPAAQTPPAAPAAPATPAPAAPAPARPVSPAPAVATPARLIIVPNARSSERLDEGCWARLFGASQAPGDSVTIVGPIDMPTLRGPFGLEWDDRIGNIEAGPRATVSLFGDEE